MCYKGHIPHNKGKTEIELYGIEKATQLSWQRSKRMIGNIPHNKGKTDEELYGIEFAKKFKEIRSRTHKGKTTAQKGKTFEEYYGVEKAQLKKEKMSNSLKGKISHNKDLTFDKRYGVERSKIIRQKMSNRKQQCIKNGFIAHNKNKKIEELYGIERAQKIKEANSRAHKGQVPWVKGKKWEQSLGVERAEQLKKEYSERSKRVRVNTIIPVRDTKIEVKLQNLLKELDIEFIPHKIINIEHKYQCDIFIPLLNVVLEADGNYWHKYPFGLEIDHIRTKEMNEKGYIVIRLWEEDIKKITKDDLFNILYKKEEILVINR